MNRAERRARTEKVRRRRVREWHFYIDELPRQPGAARDRHPLDCGTGDCSVCHPKTRRPTEAFNFNTNTRDQWEQSNKTGTH